MENIGEVALYIKGKVSITYTVLGLGYGGRGIKDRDESLQRWNLLGVASLLTNQIPMCFAICKLQK